MATRTDAYPQGVGGRGHRWRIAIAALLAALAAAPAGAAADERPNFVHILTDDQTVDSVASMPFTQIVLGVDGTTFTNHHAVQPLCCPSRASFLTGQYPHNHGVLNNVPPFGYDRLNFRRTIYTALDDAGYRTGWIGKILNDPDSRGLDPEPGFDEWLVPLGLSELDMRDYRMSDNGVAVDIADTFQNDYLWARARSFLTSPSPAPFILTLSLTSPHWTRCEGQRANSDARCPPEPSPLDRGTFDLATFPGGDDPAIDPVERPGIDAYWQRELESLQSVDRIVAAVVNELRETGELDHTYVILQSDNGMLHGEHDIFDKNVPWDRSVRIPLLIRGPGFGPGDVRSDLTANVDVPATIMDAANVKPPLPLDGYSLLGEHRRRLLLLERLNGSARTSATQPWRQVKTASGWTYWRELISGRRHLYNLNEDPLQLRNRVRDRPKLARRLEEKIDKFRRCKAPCP